MAYIGNVLTSFNIGSSNLNNQAVTAAKLSPSSVGSNGQVLAVDGSGNLVWANDAKNDTLTTQGELLYRDGSGYQRLGAGTSGYYLKTQGAGANPVWAAIVQGLSSDAQYNTVGGTNAGDSFSGTNASDNTLIGYNAGTATYAYLPINGYILEGTSTSGRNEYQSFVAPYSGRIHQLQWRTEEAVSALNSFRILESSDGTEVPGSISYRKDIDVDIADDTTYNFDLSSPTTGSTALVKGRIYVLYYSFGVDTNDTNFTVVFEWDLTT